jgi:purine nucleoside phosphorylase
MSNEEEFQQAAAYCSDISSDTKIEAEKSKKRNRYIWVPGTTFETVDEAKAWVNRDAN